MAVRARARDQEDYEEQTTVNLGPRRPDGRGSLSIQINEVDKRLSQIQEALATHEDRIQPILRLGPDTTPEEDLDPTEMRRDSSPVVEAMEELHERAHRIYESVIALTARVDV